MLTEQIRAFLAEPRFAVLATINADGSPQLTTMWYELDGDEILMNTAAGRLKERNLRRDPRVSLCFEDGYRYLTLTGTVRLDDDPVQGLAGIRRLALRYHSPEEAEQMVREQYSKQRRISIRMVIARVSEHL